MNRDGAERWSVTSGLHRCAVTRPGRLSVLLIGDDPGEVATIERLLSKSARLDRVGALQDAFAVLEQGREYDVVLVDLELPDSRELDALRQLRSLSNCPAVVVLTGNRDSQVGPLAMRIGAQDFLAKPALASELLERTLTHAVERHNQNERLLQTQAKLEAIFSVVPEGLLTVDGGGAIRSFNRHAKEMLGAQQDLYGSPLSVFLPDLELGSHGSRRGARYQAVRGDGSRFAVDVVVADFDHDRGQLVVLSDPSAKESPSTYAGSGSACGSSSQNVEP